MNRIFFGCNFCVKVFCSVCSKVDKQLRTYELRVKGRASLHDFHLSLAKQATPVIEVRAAKKITVIISEGKELEIREIEGEPF